MIQFKELLETCQVEAIANKLNPTEEAVWRNFCRTYSVLFHTPLHLVLKMAPEHVILNIYEHQIEDIDLTDYQKLEHLNDLVCSIEDPNYEMNKEKETEDFIAKAEREEEERLKSGKSIVPKKILLEKNTKKEENKPTGGFLDLSYLEKLDKE